MAHLSPMLFSKSNGHHFHDTAFIWSPKGCMGFYPAADNDAVRFRGIFVNEHIHAFLIDAYLFYFHG